MSEWGSGFLWGLFAAGPLMLLVTSLLYGSSVESQWELERDAHGEGYDRGYREAIEDAKRANTRPWTDEGTHSGEAA